MLTTTGRDKKTKQHKLPLLCTQTLSVQVHARHMKHIGSKLMYSEQTIKYSSYTQSDTRQSQSDPALTCEYSRKLYLFSIKQCRIRTVPINSRLEAGALGTNKTMCPITRTHDQQRRCAPSLRLPTGWHLRRSVPKRQQGYTAATPSKLIETSCSYVFAASGEQATWTS